MLAGGVLLARTLTTEGRSATRAAVQGLAGTALLAAGIRQRRAGRGGDRVETGADARRTADGEKAVSDEAHAESHQDLGAQRTADESRSVYQSESEPNPRGMSDRSDVRTDQEGDVHFVDGEEPESHRETDLEDGDANDTRLQSERDDEPTEVDVSETAMADEVSEAAGPHSGQAYPAREGTDPEPTSENAPERVGEGAVAPTGHDDEDERDDDDIEADDESEDATE